MATAKPSAILCSVFIENIYISSREMISPGCYYQNNTLRVTEKDNTVSFPKEVHNNDRCQLMFWEQIRIKIKIGRCLVIFDNVQSKFTQQRTY